MKCQKFRCFLYKIKLKKTCYACPEQYEAYYNGKQIGYLRLRHGTFTVEYPECGGELIYIAVPIGDGIFEDYERRYYLKEAKRAIERRMKKND